LLHLLATHNGAKAHLIKIKDNMMTSGPIGFFPLYEKRECRGWAQGSLRTLSQRSVKMNQSGRLGAASGDETNERREKSKQNETFACFRFSEPAFFLPPTATALLDVIQSLAIGPLAGIQVISFISFNLGNTLSRAREANKGRAGQQR
jgi:hypothetical protein